MESTEILKIAANALNEKKAKELAAVKIDKLTVIAEYFLMCTATSSTHVRALADEVEEKLGEAGVQPHEEVEGAELHHIGFGGRHGDLREIGRASCRERV